MGAASRREVTKAVAEAAAETALLEAARRLHEAKLGAREAKTIYGESHDAASEQRKLERVILKPTEPGIQWKAFLWPDGNSNRLLESKTITSEQPLEEEGVREFTVSVHEADPDDQDPRSSGVTVDFNSNLIDVNGVQARWLIAIPAYELDYLERVEVFDGQSVSRTLGEQALSGGVARPPDEAWPA